MKPHEAGRRRYTGRGYKYREGHACVKNEGVEHRRYRGEQSELRHGVQMMI